jgi:hypothetical protein
MSKFSFRWNFVKYIQKIYIINYLFEDYILRTNPEL